MDFNTVIIDRYACKKFSDQKVEREVLNAVLEAGRMAPTAKNLQEQQIYVVESAECLKIVDECTPCRYNAPTVLVVGYDKNNVFTYPGELHTSGVEDTTIVLTHLVLGAKNAGLESCWVNKFNPEELASKLNLPENVELVAIIDLGYPAEGAGPLPNHTSRKEASEYTYYL